MGIFRRKSDEPQPEAEAIDPRDLREATRSYEAFMRGWVELPPNPDRDAEIREIAKGIKQNRLKYGS